MNKLDRHLKILSLDLNQACQEIEFPADAIIYGLDQLYPARLIIGAPASGGTVRRKVWILSNADRVPASPLNTIGVEAQQNEMIGFSAIYDTPTADHPNTRYFVVYVETQINAATRASTTRR